MNKIFVYSLGVLGFMHTLACSAIEKFEILPDLPDPLAYAVQPAVAATVSGADSVAPALASQSIGQEPNMLSVFFSLVFVILLIYATGIIYTRMNKAGFKTFKRQQGDLAKSQVSVVSTTQLGNNKTLHVVELDGKRMLIGASSSAIQLIKDLGSVSGSGDEEEYSHIEIPNIKIPKIEIPKIEIPSIGFSKLVTKTHKKFVEEDAANDEVTNESSVIAKEEEQVETELVVENSDGIIDSLFAAQEDVVVDEIDEKTSKQHVVDPEDFALYKKYLG